MRIKPAYTYAQWRGLNSDSRLDSTTYCAAQFTRRETKLKNPTVGAIFTDKSQVGGYSWRVVKVTENWVYAVPSQYVENYYE